MPLLNEAQIPASLNARADGSTSRPLIIYIVGAGHCGSTLLSLSLDRHSDILAVSEIVGLNAQEPGHSGGKDYRNNPFWSRVAANYQRDFEEDFWAVHFASLTKSSKLSSADWRKQNQNAFFSIAKTAGTSFIIDASKQPRRLQVLLQEDSVDVRVIYLTRDARAVVHSYDRKYKSFWRGFRQIRRLDPRARSIKARFPNIPWMTLRYEDMTEDFEKTIVCICEFCGLPFQCKMLKPDTASFKGIGGNRLQLKPVKKITNDKSWERDMPTWKKWFISLLMFRYQRSLGYPIFCSASKKERIK